MAGYSYVFRANNTYASKISVGLGVNGPIHEGVIVCQCIMSP